jgi:lipopolysaccharide assembly protein A
MKVVYWTAILGLAIILGLFAASNREAVSLGLWPLPFLVGLPLYLVVFAAVIAGFLVGALTTWAAGARRRRELRRCRRRNEALARELAATQAQINEATRPAAAVLPAIR